MNSEQSQNKLFMIHDIKVNTAENYLITPKGALIVEPKIMMLLNYLIEHAGEVVSRDDLLNDVWAGTIVSDNAVNWSISQLRKLLDDKSSSPRFIKTISKKGYQFIAPVTTIDSIEPLPLETVLHNTESADTNPNQTLPLDAALSKTKPSKIALLRRYATMVSISLVIVFAFISNHLNWFNTNTAKLSHQYTLKQHQYATLLPGLEQDPQLTADGQLLLFRYSIDKPDAKSALYLKPIQTANGLDTIKAQEKIQEKINEASVINQHGQPAFPITDQSSNQQFDYRYAIWSMNGRRIYAVRINPQHQCEIVELSLSTGRNKIINASIIESCHPHGHSKLTLDDEHQILYFTNRDQSRDHKLFRHDLATGKTEYQATPFETGFGIRFIDYSAKQHKLLLLQDIGWAKTNFILFDPVTQQSEIQLSRNSVYHSAFWGPKSEDIWLNWGNDTVKAYHLNDKTMTTLLKSNSGWNTSARAVNDSTAYYTVSNNNRSDLVFVNSAFTSTQTPFSEEQATFSRHSERIAFISSNNQTQQIWLQAPKQQPKRLTTANQHLALQALQWSFDDKYILGVAGETLASIDVDNHRLRIHYRHDQKHGLIPLYPTWLPDNKHIVFSANDGEKWQLYQVAAKQTPQQPTKLAIDNGYISQAVGQNLLLFSRYNQSGLWQYNLANKQQKQRLTQLPANVYWRVVDQQVFFITTDQDNNQTVKTLYRTPLTQYAPQKMHRLPDASNDRFDVRRNSKTGKIELVYSDFTHKKSNLKTAKIHYSNQSDELRRVD